MRIHLLCDQKWRDLPNLTAIKIILERLGHQVLLSTTKDQEPMILAFRPDCVVFNHLFAPSNQKLARDLRSSGIAVVVLSTEGAVRPEFRGLADGEFARDWSIDLYLAWSDEAAEGVRGRWGMNEKTVPVIGCTRFDFYTDRFRATIMPREMFCQQHNFDPSRKIVTWATAFGYAGIQRDPARLKRFLSEAELNGLSQCYRRIGIEPSRVPEMHEAARDASSRAFVALAKARPDVQFILRPHPVDDRNYFRRLIDENALKNTRFCPQDYIWNILAASDVHLHRQCTTAVEAWMWDKPTIEMDMENIAEWRWSDREMGSDTAHDKHELIELVDGYLSGSSVDGDVLSYRKSYVEKWFGPQDGRRCAAAADAIDQLLVGRSRTRRRFDPIAGIESTSRAVVSAVLRHMLGKLPNESILRSVPATQLDPMDKMVTRRDVKAYKSLIAAAVN